MCPQVLIIVFFSHSASFQNIFSRETHKKHIRIMFFFLCLILIGNCRPYISLNSCSILFSNHPSVLCSTLFSPRKENGSFSWFLFYTADLRLSPPVCLLSHSTKPHYPLQPLTRKSVHFLWRIKSKRCAAFSKAIFICFLSIETKRYVWYTLQEKKEENSDCNRHLKKNYSIFFVEETAHLYRVRCSYFDSIIIHL